MTTRFVSVTAAVWGLALTLASCGASDVSEQAPADSADAATPRRVIRPEGFPADPAHSPGILVGDTLYLSAQLSLDPQTGEQPATVAEQTHQAMKNVGRVLDAAGLGYGNLVSCRVLLDDMENYQAMNAVYGGYYEEGRYPARTTLEVPGLPSGAHIAVACTAFADGGRIRVIRPPEGTTPPAMGPYSPGVLAGQTLYLSGQGGRDPASGEVPEAVEDQAEITLSTIGAILNAAELDFGNVVEASNYYLGSGNAAALAGPYGERFSPTSAPASGSVRLSRLPGTISVEITFAAYADAQAITRYAPRQGGAAMPASAAVLAGDTIYLSALTAAGSAPDSASRLRAAFEQLKQELGAAAMDLGDVVAVNLYVNELEDLAAIDALFSEIFPDDPPARTAIRVFPPDESAEGRDAVSLIAVR